MPVKANRRVRSQLGDDDEGAIGIGTMIVFIAMVIVAAVAAAVIISTAGNLQRKSQETGKETQQEVTGNIFIRDIMGNVSDDDGDGTDEIVRVSWYVSLAPGAEPVDLQNMIIRWQHGDNLTDLQYNSTGNCAELSDGFCVVDVFDAGDSDPAVLSEGDRVRIEVHLNANYGKEAISPRESIDVLYLPEMGSPVTASFKAPATFGGHSNVGLI